LNLGISILGKRHWRDQYHLSLDLYNAAAEVEYCNANFDRMDALINEVLENARCADDKIRAFTASIYSLGSRNELQKATDLGFQVLKDLGEPFPSKGRTTTILFEFFRTKRMLQKLSDDDILNLPMMYDVNKLAALRIMNLLYAYTLNGRPRLAPLIAMRLVQTTLSGGLSGMGCVGFSAFGMLLCMAFGDVDLGIRLARVGIKVLDTFQAKEWLARVYAASYMFRFPCMEPLIAQLQPLLLSHRVELGSGDIEFAMLSAAGYAAVAWHASMPLPQLLEEMQSFLALMKLHKQTNMVQFLLPNMQLVLNMMGHSNDSVGLTGVAMKEDLAMQEAVRTQNYTVIALLHYIRLVLASYFQNYEMVEIASGKLARCKQGTDSFPFSNKASWYLHEGLSSIHIGSTPPRSRHRVGTAKRCLKKMKNVARCSPANTLNKVYLLEAEIAAGHGKIYEALEKFNDSISSAGKDNMLNEAGLACERAAMLLNRTGREKEAASFLEKAITAYDEWGAHGKGDLIRKLLSSSHYK
jgi:predicted ATPase